MASAPPAVRAAARYVAPPVEDEGAAQVIEALVLAGRSAPRNVESCAAGGEVGRAAMTARVLPDDARAAPRRSTPCGQAGSSWRCRPTRSTGSASRSTPGRARAAVRGQAAPARQGRSSCSWPTIARRMRSASSTRPRTSSAAAFWPGGLTLVVPQRPAPRSRPSSPAARHDRPPRARTTTPRGPRRGARSAADQLGQSLGRAGRPRRRRGPRASSATPPTSRSSSTVGPAPRRRRLDRGRLRRRSAADPPPGGDPARRAGGGPRRGRPRRPASRLIGAWARAGHRRCGTIARTRRSRCRDRRAAARPTRSQPSGRVRTGRSAADRGTR